MAAAPEIIRLRSSETCGTCGSSLYAGTFVVWDGEAKSATCEACLAEAPVNTATDREPTR